MTNTWLQKWNERYKQDGYAYGIYPNEFLKNQLKKLKPGKILFAAEGEGRNAVFAAKEGWAVSAFDISPYAQKKALQLALDNNVSIDYKTGELPDLDYTKGEFDAIALIYAHFPSSIKSQYHKLLAQLVRSNGVIIFEAFSKKHLKYQQLNKSVGGPSDLESLFSMEEIQSDFDDFEIIELTEKEIELKEGAGHNGIGSVVRFVGRKK